MECAVSRRSCINFSYRSIGIGEARWIGEDSALNCPSIPQQRHRRNRSGICGLRSSHDIGGPSSVQVTVQALGDWAKRLVPTLLRRNEVQSRIFSKAVRVGMDQVSHRVTSMSLQAER